MTTIKIEDLNVNAYMVNLDIEEVAEVKGGCPVCIPLILIAAGYMYEASRN